MPQINKWEKPFHVERGDVYMADLGSEGLDDEDLGSQYARGSQQAGVRPVVVTQCNRQNRTSPTVVVAAGTSHLKRQDLPYHVVLPPTKGLRKRTMVCAEQRFTISIGKLISYCCTLDKFIMGKITRACHRAEEADKARRCW